MYKETDQRILVIKQARVLHIRLGATTHGYGDAIWCYIISSSIRASSSTTLKYNNFKKHFFDYFTGIMVKIVNNIIKQTLEYGVKTLESRWSTGIRYNNLVDIKSEYS